MKELSSYNNTLGNVKWEQLEIHGLFLQIFICSKFFHMYILISCTAFFFKYTLSQSLHTFFPSESILKHLAEFPKR